VKVAVMFDNFGPYHLARLWAAAQVCELTAVEVAASSGEYAWQREAETGSFKTVTLLEQGTSREVQSHEVVRRMRQALDELRPQVVFIPGWSGRVAFAALDWCVRNRVPAVAMSESTEGDETRASLKEWIKRKLVGLCASALAGGKPHKDYLVKLGMTAENVFLGYDAVDNGYFVQGTKDARSQKPEVRRKFSLPENYFLASARFIEKKNLPRLIEAYARYRELAAAKSEIGNRKSEIWSLVLLGDGVLRESLNSQLSTLNLRNHVQMPGFIQYPDLPAYYGLAGAFIHASTTEQWGLVVNEAMASGLPVLVSNRCGCATSLVQESLNGFTFDPYNVEELAQLMLKLSTMPDAQLSTLAQASQRIIADWGPERFAAGLKTAVDKALEVGPKRAGILEQLLLRALSL
jgi:1,2-diacylglycerol 3-alpha-glucosyltransferase